MKSAHYATPFNSCDSVTSTASQKQTHTTASSLFPQSEAAVEQRYVFDHNQNDHHYDDSDDSLDNYCQSSEYDDEDDAAHEEFAVSMQRPRRVLTPFTFTNRYMERFTVWAHREPSFLRDTILPICESPLCTVDERDEFNNLRAKTFNWNPSDEYSLPSASSTPESTQPTTPVTSPMDLDDVKIDEALLTPTNKDFCWADDTDEDDDYFSTPPSFDDC